MGELWSAVIDKARALHLDDDNQFDEYTECERNGSKPWGCGGISDAMADIHFAAVMTFLLKSSGDPDDTYTQLMTDWRSMELSQKTSTRISTRMTCWHLKTGSTRTTMPRRTKSH
jgi:hypothetical protein